MGIGLIAAAPAIGVALLASLPWPSIVLAGVGAFMVALWVIATVRQAAARRSPFTPIIERGYALRERLVADPEADPDLAYVTIWQTRIQDWTEEARAVIRRVAPNRDGAFMIDLLVADSSTMRSMPMWKSELMLDFDIRLERLILVRASL